MSLKTFKLWCYSIASTGGIFNGMVIYRYSKGQIPRNSLVLNMLIADFCVSVTTCPLKIYRQLNDDPSLFINSKNVAFYLDVLEQIPVACATLSTMGSSIFRYELSLRSKSSNKLKISHFYSYVSLTMWTWSYVIVTADLMSFYKPSVFNPTVCLLARLITTVYLPIMAVVICHATHHSLVHSTPKPDSVAIKPRRGNLHLPLPFRANSMLRETREGGEDAENVGTSSCKLVTSVPGHISRGYGNLTAKQAACFHIVGAKLFVTCWLPLAAMDTLNIILQHVAWQTVYEVSECIGILHSVFSPLLLLSMNRFNWKKVCVCCGITRFMKGNKQTTNVTEQHEMAEMSGIQNV